MIKTIKANSVLTLRSKVDIEIQNLIKLAGFDANKGHRKTVDTKTDLYIMQDKTVLEVLITFSKYRFEAKIHYDICE